MNTTGDNMDGYPEPSPFRRTLSHGLKGLGAGIMAASGSSLGRAFNAAQGETEQQIKDAEKQQQSSKDFETDEQNEWDMFMKNRTTRKLMKGVSSPAVPDVSEY